MHSKTLHGVSWILLIIGGLNWGLSALGLNVIDYLGDILSRIVYILVGLSAVYELMVHKHNCKLCGVQGSSNMGQTM